MLDDYNEIDLQEAEMWERAHQLELENEQTNEYLDDIEMQNWIVRDQVKRNNDLLDTYWRMYG